MKILVLNGGSSSFKCWLAELPNGELPGTPVNPLWSANADLTHGSPETVLDSALKELVGQASGLPNIVGHRIVHGGPKYRESTVLTTEVRKAIAEQVEFAPAHNRFELEAVQAVDRIIGTDLKQIAVFDTAFHSTIEPAAYVYPGPYSWLEDGVRRYGFHGINHQYVTGRAAEILGRPLASLKLISCHLGNGASVAAVRGGKSIDTTMGFTPLEGLMMGTRSGSLDPGILVYLIRHRGYTAEQLDRILNKESGLLGISGLSGDMREILKAMDASDQRARLAFDIYAHRLTREIGSMLAVLGGVDALIFTGGVGENCAPLRKIIADRFAFLGSALQILVIKANEEWQIAKECHRLLSV